MIFGKNVIQFFSGKHLNFVKTGICIQNNLFFKLILSFYYNLKIIFINVDISNYHQIFILPLNKYDAFQNISDFYIINRHLNFHLNNKNYICE